MAQIKLQKERLLTTLIWVADFLTPRRNAQSEPIIVYRDGSGIVQQPHVKNVFFKKQNNDSAMYSRQNQTFISDTLSENPADFCFKRVAVHSTENFGSSTGQTHIYTKIISFLLSEGRVVIWSALGKITFLISKDEEIFILSDLLLNRHLNKSISMGNGREQNQVT